MNNHDTNEAAQAAATQADVTQAPFDVMFVCTGNICRSPMAEAVLRSLAVKAGLDKRINVSSAGTGDWHVGEQADTRTLSALAKRGYDASHHRAKQFDIDSFRGNDLVVVFDRSQERILQAWARTDQERESVRMLLSFDNEQAHLLDIQDPYYSDDAFFDTVLGMIEKASIALFRQLAPALS